MIRCPLALQKGRRITRIIDGKECIEKGDPDDMFADDYGVMVECPACGQLRIIPSKRNPYCNGEDGTGCPADVDDAFDG